MSKTCVCHTLRKLPVKVSLVIYFPCKGELSYQECGDSACRSHNEITRQINGVKLTLLGLVSCGPGTLVNFTPFVL